MEAEFFLLRENEDGGIELVDPLDRLEQPCYDMKGLTRQYEFLSTLSKYVNESVGGRTPTTTKMQTANSS